MGKKLIEINGLTSVSPDDVSRVWVANTGDAYVKTSDGDVYPIDRAPSETPFDAKLRIEKLVNEAQA